MNAIYKQLIDMQKRLQEALWELEILMIAVKRLEDEIPIKERSAEERNALRIAYEMSGAI